MGSVAEITTSGDNDPEIFPVRYWMHYLYCDACGSFEIGSWLEPENHEQVAAMQRRLHRLAIVLLVATAVAAMVALRGTNLWLWLSLAALAVSMTAIAALGSRIKERGLRCARCGATYAHGSAFFSDFKQNPRQLTMADVPRPLYLIHQIRGDELGPAAEEKRSRLPA